MRLLTIKELAELLKVKEKTLYQWAELRQIPCLKLCGSLRFDADEIEKWVAGCKITPISEYNPLRQEARKGGQK